MHKLSRGNRRSATLPAHQPFRKEREYVPPARSCQGQMRSGIIGCCSRSFVGPGGLLWMTGRANAIERVRQGSLPPTASAVAALRQSFGRLRTTAQGTSSASATPPQGGSDRTVERTPAVRCMPQHEGGAALLSGKTQMRNATASDPPRAGQESHCRQSPCGPFSA